MENPLASVPLITEVAVPQTDAPSSSLDGDSSGKKEKKMCRHLGCNKEFSDDRGRRRHEQQQYNHPFTDNHPPTCEQCHHWQQKNRFFVSSKDQLGVRGTPGGGRKKSNSDAASPTLSNDHIPDLDPMDPSAGMHESHLVNQHSPENPSSSSLYVNLMAERTIMQQRISSCESKIKSLEHEKSMLETKVKIMEQEMTALRTELNVMKGLEPLHRIPNGPEDDHVDDSDEHGLHDDPHKPARKRQKGGST